MKGQEERTPAVATSELYGDKMEVDLSPLSSSTAASSPFPPSSSSSSKASAAVSSSNDAVSPSTMVVSEQQPTLSAVQLTATSLSSSSSSASVASLMAGLPPPPSISSDMSKEDIAINIIRHQLSDPDEAAIKAKTSELVSYIREEIDRVTMHRSL